MNINLWDFYLQKAARYKLSLESSAVSFLVLYRTRNWSSCRKAQGLFLHLSIHHTAIWSRFQNADQNCWLTRALLVLSGSMKRYHIKPQLLCSLAAFSQDKHRLHFFQSGVQWVTTKLLAYVFFSHINQQVDPFALTYTPLLTVCNLRFCTISSLISFFPLPTALSGDPYLSIWGGIDPVVVNTSFVPERDG